MARILFWQTKLLLKTNWAQKQILKKMAQHYLRFNFKRELRLKFWFVFVAILKKIGQQICLPERIGRHKKVANKIMLAKKM